MQNLTFSEDSRHLYWNKKTPAPFLMYADGKAVLEGGAPSWAGFAKEVWQTAGADGMLVLMRDASGYKRVSVIASPDTAISTR